MSATRQREPVPRVPPMSSRTRNTAHLSGEFPFTEMPKSGPRVTTENHHIKEKTTMANAASQFKRLIVDNQEVIKRKFLIGAGAAVGLIITGTIVDLVNRPSKSYPERVVFIRESDVAEPSSEDLEP